MREEARELRGYAALARSITVNEKAVKLNHALDLGFERLRELGAPREGHHLHRLHQVTQEYIARSLTEGGTWRRPTAVQRPERLACRPPRSTRPGSKKNKGGDVITGILAADRRKALVDYFRDEGTIMIATEAAVGRHQPAVLLDGRQLRPPVEPATRRAAHRSRPPLRPEARRRRRELLQQGQRWPSSASSNCSTDKFHLFKGVFGASDEVLGTIEDGLDFEKTISDILNSLQDGQDIERAFKELEKQFEGEISQEMAHAKAKVFDNLDPNVQDRLKSYDAQSGEVLNKFERLLLAVTKHQLADVATFEGDGRRLRPAHSAGARSARRVATSSSPNPRSTPTSTGSQARSPDTSLTPRRPPILRRAN